LICYQEYWTISTSNAGGDRAALPGERAAGRKQISALAAMEKRAWILFDFSGAQNYKLNFPGNSSGLFIKRGRMGASQITLLKSQ
jgi:hypothetical protein